MRPLRVLLVEDREEDAELLLRELRGAGWEPTVERVQDEGALLAALDRTWDVVIADYSLPSFSGLRALELVRGRGLDTPFVVVSGTVDEAMAVEAMRAGAHDFVLKDRLARLAPAIERELREAQMRAERRQMQDQLLVSDRMASVGTLASGVAHEINNPLAALMANLEILNRDLVALGRSQAVEGALDEMAECLNDAREAAERVRLIVRDLRLFSRGEEDRRGPVDIRRVLDSSIRMAWNEIRHRARLVKEYGDVGAVEGNEARLGQVFLNLVMNAAQAIREGRAEQNEIRVAIWEEGKEHVVVEVRDTGTGISPEVRARMFDPFFTTKPIGVGTGLGLSICHRIVTQLGGTITIENAPERGTVARVVLRRASSDFPGAQPPPGNAGPAARRGRILVIDDEVSVGKAIKRMLAGEHEVVAMTDAEQALRALAAGQTYDLILCDLMMPEMTGMDLHAELLRVAPAAAERMVFITGGAFTPRARQFLDGVSNPRIDKPFNTDTVRSLLRSLLKGS